MEYGLIGLFAIAAFFLKGVIGTGTGTVMVALCSLMIGPKEAIVLVSFVNIFGGLAMLRIDPAPLRPGYWGPVAACMVFGSFFGAAALKAVDPVLFEIILGAAFLGLSVWFLFTAPPEARTRTAPGQRPASRFDMCVGAVAGFCGGFIGVNAPLLISHFGRFLDKRYLRRLLVLVFIPAAMASTAAFLANGLFTGDIIFYALAVLPGMALGIYLGNKAHYKIPEIWFRRMLGVFLVIVSARLIF